MSFNQSRSDRSEQHYRKSGRSDSYSQQWNSSGGYGKGRGGGPAPSPSLSSSSASSRSFKKSNNAQGGQSRVNSQAVNSTESSNASATRDIQNGARAQSHLKGTSDTPVTSSPAKPVDSHANQRSTRAVPKPPTSQSSYSSIPATPTKGDASQALSLQFGSISSGFMNGMQIPARTSSAPPNFDEQKRDQACQESSFKPVSNLPTPAPKQQLPKKDSSVINQSNSGEAHPVPKVKKDVQASAGPPVNQTQNPALINLPMQMPFHLQPQVSMQFGGPNPHIRSQTPSVQMPMHMPLPMGNVPQVMQQPVFVPGLHPILLPPQGMMHQVQGLSFTQPLGSLGMGIAPQYSQQQGGKFGVPRKTTPVKITHPETREELRLNKRTETYLDGGSSGPRSHPNVPPQSQPVPSFAPSHLVSYYSNSYNTNSMFYPPPTSLPLSSCQMAVVPNDQGPRFPVGQSHQNISYMNSAAADGSLPVNKSLNIRIGTSESPSFELAPDGHNVASSAPLGITHVTVKPVTVSVGEKVSDSSLSISLPPVEEDGSLKPSVTSSDGSLSSAPAVTFEVSIGNEGVIDTDVFSSKISNSTMFESSNVDITFGSNASPSAIDGNEIIVTKSGASDQHFAPATTPDLSDSISKYEGGVPVPSTKDKPAPEFNRTKSASTRGGKNRKEIIQRTDAAGATSDLYMAFKGPEEKKGTIPSASANSNCNGVNLKLVSHASPQVDSTKSDKIAKTKTELDDWEDAADISVPKLETSENFEKAHEGIINHEEDGSGNISKKYSRDFLLKFAEQCADLPQDFEIASDIAEALIVANVNTSHLVDRDSYPSPGRRIDRQYSGSRFDRRASGMVDYDRWMKLPGSFVPGRDVHLDLAYGASAAVAGFQPVQGGNFGVPRHARVPTTLPFVGAMFPGQMHPMDPQGWIPRSPVTDRWQRVPNYQQKGLISLPQTPLQMMHKAERKYEVGKVTDEEALKQRQLKAILNKLTPQNFEKLFEQVKAVNIDNAGTLTGVISQIFDKALMEPTFCEMYANFCYHLAGELPDFSEDNEKITFKRLLLNKCQEEFERGEREQEEANKVEEEGDAKQSVEEREEKRIKARRRMLGNIRLIGELYKKKMLTERIMHECIKKLLGEYENPDEEDVEALCKLMSTIGEMIDHPKAKVHMDAYFERMAKLSNNMKLSSRVRFMLKDAIDLRKNKWQQRRKVDGPKKIEDVHRDAAQERQAQTSRLARGPGINPGAKRAPLDFGSRVSMLSSPGAQVGSSRWSPTQHRGVVARDVRMDDRQSFVTRNLSVPLPQRPYGDDSITLGPHGGLARGMTFRGPPAMLSTPLSDVSPISGDSKRMVAGLNGLSSPAASPAQGQISGFTKNIPPEKSWPEERLMEMCMAAIKEFYSARDEKEVGLCIKDLHCLSFHPRMVALWVTDSFERKDMERDLLAKLLVNLARSHDGVLSQVHLVKGFEFVLSTLEDAVNDAPKAAEFLGRIFAKTIVENVITLSEIGRLIHDGGEEPGCLLETGLAADVLGSTLLSIKTDKGETFLNEILASSSLRLNDFRPPHPSKFSILDKFFY